MRRVNRGLYLDQFDLLQRRNEKPVYIFEGFGMTINNPIRRSGT
jgi:hypothetical protein